MEAAQLETGETLLDQWSVFLLSTSVTVLGHSDWPAFGLSLAAWKRPSSVTRFLQIESMPASPFPLLREGLVFGDMGLIEFRC